MELRLKEYLDFLKNEVPKNPKFALESGVYKVQINEANFTVQYDRFYIVCSVTFEEYKFAYTKEIVLQLPSPDLEEIELKAVRNNVALFKSCFLFYGIFCKENLPKMTGLKGIIEIENVKGKEIFRRMIPNFTYNSFKDYEICEKEKKGIFEKENIFYA